MLRNAPIKIPEEIEKRLYQLVISRLNGDEIHQTYYRTALRDLVKKGIGGFIVFGGAKDGMREFIHELQSLADIPLFIASDVERGVGQQIKGATSLPCPMAIAAALDRSVPEDAALLENALKGVADEAIDNGINMPLIPVVDVNQEPDNPIICTRAFSDDPETVSWFGSEYIRTLEHAGLISCAKHFPGHGDTDVDSHIALPVINKSKENLKNTDLVPFVKAIETGVSSVMIGHLAVPSLDVMPATFSKKIICDLLREELGFKGLVLTDALDMHALGNPGDLPVKCINAGADILLHPADAGAVVSRLLSARASGEVDERTINNAAGRITKAKERLGHQMPVKADYAGNCVLSTGISDR
ncbi:MAG: glycoside hydrolase family 3 N-terminal domain-containing protein [Dissulfurispiraceae bacterium]